MSLLFRRRRLVHTAEMATQPSGQPFRNILSESAPLLAVLVPASSSMAAVSKAFTPLPWKSDRNDAEVGEQRESHMLRFGKCL